MKRIGYVIKTEKGFYLEAIIPSESDGSLTRYINQARVFGSVGRARKCLQAFRIDGIKYSVVTVETELVIREV